MAAMSDKDRAVAKKLQSGAVPYGLEKSLKGWSIAYPPLDHQLTAIAWMYLVKKSFLFDGTGVGKTGSAIGLIELLRSQGEIGPHKPALIVCPSGLMHGSWLNDGFKKFTPSMNVALADGTKAKRRKIYADRSWDVLMVSYGVLRNDVDLLKEIDFGLVVYDEAEALKNHTSKVHKAAVEVTKKSRRAVAMTATPSTAKDLMGIHGLITVLGLKPVFGSKTAFERYYHKIEFEEIFTKVGRPPRQKVIKRKVPVIKGLKNVAEFKDRFRPYYLRRRKNDLKNVKTPDLKSQPKRLEMTREQEKLYKQAKQGYVKLDKTHYKELKNAARHLREIATSAALVDGGDHSSKMDWIVEQLGPEGEWHGEKAVLFASRLKCVTLLEKRLKEAGIKGEVVTGSTPKPKREEARQRFWNDPECMYFLGTTAIERGLNLQVSRLQINLDMLFNPARHEQLAGRVDRIGSVHEEAWVFFLLSAGTIDEATYKLLNEKQGVSDFIFDDKSDVFDQLSAEELYELVRS